MSDYRVKVRRAYPEGWAARLEDERGEQIPVGVFDDQPEAIMRGCTALRFVAAGIPWRAKGLSDDATASADRIADAFRANGVEVSSS